MRYRLVRHVCRSLERRYISNVHACRVALYARCARACPNVLFTFCEPRACTARVFRGMPSRPAGQLAHRRLWREPRRGGALLHSLLLASGHVCAFAHAQPRDWLVRSATAACTLPVASGDEEDASRCLSLRLHACACPAELMVSSQCEGGSAPPSPIACGDEEDASRCLSSQPHACACPAELMVSSPRLRRPRPSP